MFLRRGPDLNGVPQFWLELFDHFTRRSVDSFLCHQVKDAAPIFDEFMSHAAYLNKSPPGSSKEHSRINLKPSGRRTSPMSNFRRMALFIDGPNVYMTRRWVSTSISGAC
jgi:hypothetical protein